MLLLNPGEEDFEDEEERDEEELEMGLSRVSQYDLDSQWTMKVHGEIEGVSVVILIDCGATHTYVNTALAEKLSLLAQERRFSVTLGDGKKIYGNGLCLGLKLKVQGALFEQDCYLLKLGDVDVILGMDWLTKLWEVKCNWKNQTLKFK